MEEIISNMSSIIVLANLVILLLNTIITFCRKKKGRAGSVEVEVEGTESHEDTFVILDGIIQEGMKFAETLGVSGAAKKMIALAQISMKCVENDIDFKTIKDYVMKHIEELVDFSKTVNFKAVNKNEQCSLLNTEVPVKYIPEPPVEG